jgi:hypothetical protein
MDYFYIYEGKLVLGGGIAAMRSRYPTPSGYIALKMRGGKRIVLFERAG